MAGGVLLTLTIASGVMLLDAPGRLRMALTALVAPVTLAAGVWLWMNSVSYFVD